MVACTVDTTFAEIGQSADAGLSVSAHPARSRAESEFTLWVKTA